MADSKFTNSDFDVIRVRFRTRGEENMKLFRDSSDYLKGPAEATFSFCWKDRDEEIANDEFDQYSAVANYGDDFTFGAPAGRAP